MRDVVATLDAISNGSLRWEHSQLVVPKWSEREGCPVLTFLAADHESILSAIAAQPQITVERLIQAGVPTGHISEWVGEAFAREVPDMGHGQAHG